VANADGYASLATSYHWFLDDTRLLVGCDTPGVRLALRAIPPSGRVLDAACGLGIDATFLARRGLDVTAADASAAMVEQARRRLEAAGVGGVEARVCKWSHLDDMFGESPFDAVMCVGSSLAHTEDLAEVLAAFHSVLVDGGLLIVDTRDWEATASPEPLVEVEPLLVEREGRRCRRRYLWRQPEPSGPVELVASLEFLAADGRVLDTRSWTVRQNAFTRQQLRSALESAGFRSIALDFVPGDDRYTATARR
jgi:ubiquinone/menaquinone biosynthesis C-methylase UbiE